MENKVLAMLKIQDDLNSKLDPNWRQTDWDFLLAAKVEVAEALDHLGYKWWKPQEPNLTQAFMECVDIWHFVSSAILKNSEPTESTAQLLKTYIRYCLDKPALTLESAVRFCFVAGNVWHLLDYLTALIRALGYTFDDLYTQYVGKAALNQFRWEHDYSGSYQKVWQGREDNEHLSEILQTLQPHEVSLEFVKTLLSERYQSCVA